MFEQLFKRDATVQRYLGAPLARSRSEHLHHWDALGAKPSTLRTIAVTQLALLRYADVGKTGMVPLPRVEEAADRWLAEEPGRRNGNETVARRRFVWHAAGWLEFAGRLERPVTTAHPTDSRLKAFTEYMRQERGWSESTIRTRRATAGEFLRHCFDASLPLESVSLYDIDQAVAEKGSRDGWSRSSQRIYAGALRGFLGYAEEQGWCRRGLAAAVTSPRVFAGEDLPAGPAWDDVRKLLSGPWGDGAASVRNRAILLLLTQYGLRAGEICGLRLDDIDWEAETLSVRRSKPGRTNRYPLVRSTGDAILRYLREARPCCDRREVFLTLIAPVGPLCPGTVSGVVRSRMRRLGIESRRSGAHALRHAFAQNLLEEGFSMKEIGDCLGHRSPNSTAVYAKVNHAALRRVANFEPGWLA